METAEVIAVRAAVPGVVRRNTFLLAVAQFIAWLAIQMVVALGALIVFRLTASQAWAGLPITVFGITSALTAPYAGRLMDRIGRRPVLLTGQVILGIGSLVAAAGVLYSSLALFLAGLVIMGSGSGIATLSRSSAADMYPPSRRAEGISLVVMGGAVGAIGGPLLLGTFSDWANRAGADPLALPWAGLFLFTLGGLAAMAAIKPDPRDIAAHLSDYYPGEVEPLLSPLQPARPLGSILRQYPVVVAVAATALVQAGMSMFMATTPLDMKLHGHGDAVYSTLAGHFFGMLGLSVLIGRAADRLGRKTVIVSGAVVFTVGALVTPLSENPLYSGMGLFLVGLGWSLCYVAGNTVLADMTRPLERAGTVGANDMLVGLVSAVAALTAGLLLGGAGFLTVGILGTVLVTVPFMLALRLREPAPGQYSPSLPT